MNSSASVRRQEQPVKIGNNHGYRIEGDHAYLNAELNVPPYHPGGAWALELWAAEQAYQDGELTGLKLAEVQLELPTPLAAYVHRIEADAPARLPTQTDPLHLFLALVERNGARRVHDVANYPAQNTFPAPRLLGAVHYRIEDGLVSLNADNVINTRGGDNLSGTLSIELWARPLNSAEGAGQCLVALQLLPLSGQQCSGAIACQTPLTPLPAGRWKMEVVLREWTQAFGYVTRDQRELPEPYVVERPTTSRTSRLPSIQTASVDELARVKGLNLRLAKEISKARPFSSLDELLKVNGIGKKTLDRLRSLLTL